MEKKNPTHITEWFQRNQWFNRCGKHLGGGWYKARIANALGIGQIIHHHSPVLKKNITPKRVKRNKAQKTGTFKQQQQENKQTKTKLPVIKLIDILAITGLHASLIYCHLFCTEFLWLVLLVYIYLLLSLILSHNFTTTVIIKFHYSQNSQFVPPICIWEQIWFYLVISLLHYGVTWDAHVRLAHQCFAFRCEVQVCECSLSKITEKNPQHHRFHRWSDNWKGR